MGHRRLLRAGLAAVVLLLLPPTSVGVAEDRPETGRVYVTMADGTELAVYLEFPEAWDGETPLPVILQYDGYEGGGAPSWHTAWLDRDNYVLARAGVRGAGCSGGSWDFHSVQEARDGAALVDWLGTQWWSTGDVGLNGHSYPAHMAILTAAQRPRHLRAVTVSGTGDSLYRDFSFPGGVPNRFVGIYWFLVREYDSDYPAFVDLFSGETDCFEHTVERQRYVQSFLMANGAAASSYFDDEDNHYWHSRSPGTHVGQIEVPVHIDAFSGDEWVPGSTNGSAQMFQKLPNPNKQLIITNGSHGAWELEPAVTDRRMAWLDRWVRGVPNGVENEPRVRVLLESYWDDSSGTWRLFPTGEVESNDFPLEGTEWTRLYADAEGALSTTPPTETGSELFAVTPRRVGPSLYETGEGHYVGQEVHQATGPDEANYRTAPAEETTVIAGPIVATLYARIFSNDADLAVNLQIEGTDGSRSLVTKGFLRASHRAVDPERSGWDGDVLYRVHHPHTSAQDVPLGEIVELAIQIRAAGIVLREGDVLRMQVAGVPGFETLSLFTQKPPAVVELVHGPEHPTNLLLPTVAPPTPLGARPACGAQTAVFCHQEIDVP